MPNKELICMIDMFNSSVEFIYPDQNRESVPIVGVLTYAYDVCNTEGINKLHLVGNRQYIEGLLEEFPPTNYNCGKVEIKVN